MSTANFLKNFMDKIQLPKEAISFFLALNQKTESCPDISEMLDQAQVHIFRYQCMGNLKAELDYVAKELSSSPYSVYFLFFLRAAETAFQLYMDKKIEGEQFWANMTDMRYKLMECYAMHEIWGTMEIDWFFGFFLAERFALGRMQYEISPFPDNNVQVAGHLIRTGDAVCKVHIPSSGEPFDKISRQVSYDMAYRFFDLPSPFVFYCHSWLLYEGNEQILPADCNICNFMKDFKIIHSEDKVPFKDGWRIFGRYWNSECRALPKNTRVQKAFGDWLESGKSAGQGIGVFVYDGYIHH